MNIAVLEPKNVIVQGITGTHGSFHTAAMLQHGTNIVAGTSPKKAGALVHGIPVYQTISDIQQDYSIDASVIFVPALHAKGAIIEAIEAKIPLIVCITEGIPIHDMLIVTKRLKNSASCLIGPNSPGILLPNGPKLGIIPSSVGLAGDVSIVSRSGTLTYEAAAGLSACNIGQRAVVGIGGDPIKGTDFIDVLGAFQSDPATKSIVLIGEIGGSGEIAAADYISQHVTKPVFAYITGHHAPKNVQLGHAGAILSSDNESAGYKTEYLMRAGVSVYQSVPSLVNGIKDGIIQR